MVSSLLRAQVAKSGDAREKKRGREGERERKREEEKLEEGDEGEVGCQHEGVAATQERTRAWPSFGLINIVSYRWPKLSREISLEHFSTTVCRFSLTSERRSGGKSKLRDELIKRTVRARAQKSSEQHPELIDRSE